MMRILVVDDEPNVRRSLAIMLKRGGYEVTEADSVAAAIGRLKLTGEPYNLVITDLRMEPLNGFDLLALARRYRPQCPVIIVTAYGTPEARAEALETGAVDVLEKPLEPISLQARIRQILRDHGN